MSISRNILSQVKSSETHPSSLKLEDGAKVAVMGGGPAGSFFTYFILEMAQRIGVTLNIDIYEPRDFSLPGPPGCNMCGGIISESLIQNLALEGIYLPPNVVQRGMNTYILHTSLGDARLETTELEKRIASVFRGAGPKGVLENEWTSFDGYLLEQAVNKGANWIKARIEDVRRVDEGLEIRPRSGKAETYHFLAVASGVNTNALRLFPPIETSFRPPKLAQTFVREYYLGQETIASILGQNAIHFFLLDLPGLDFAAIVPKGNYVTICLLGEDLSNELIDAFLQSAEVKQCMPRDWQADAFACHCSPRINIAGAVHPFADRMVFLGDSGISRLYKDGIGAAYRAAKYAASTAILQGISKGDFDRNYWRSCRRMEVDNSIGKVIFSGVRFVKPRGFIIAAMLRMIAGELPKSNAERRLSNILWDMFTGSAPYADIMQRAVNPAFWGRLTWYVGSTLMRRA